VPERIDSHRPPSEFLAHRFPHLEDDDPEERYQRLWKSRTLGGTRTDPALYAYALGRFLREDDAKCRNAAIWMMRDAWKADRELQRAPLRAFMAGSAAGSLTTFWSCTADLLADPAVRRDTPCGEHLQWIAKQADDPLVAHLAHHAPEAFAVVGSAVTAAQDDQVRTYPRAAFVQLAGRVVEAFPDAREQLVTGLRTLAGADIKYDLRYWVERVRSANDDDGTA